MPDDMQDPGSVAAASSSGAPPTPPAPPKERRKGTIGLLIGLVLLVGGIGVGVLGGKHVADPIADQVTAPRRSVPSSFDLDLHEGTYVVYEAYGHTDPNSSYPTQDREPSLTPSRVQVTGPDGRAVLVQRMSDSNTFDDGGTQTRGRRVYQAVLELEAPQGGTYHFRIVNEPTEVIVAPGLGDTVRDALGGGALVLVAGIVVLIAIVLLIVSLVRRYSKPRTPPGPMAYAAPYGPPPGAAYGAPAPYAARPTTPPPGWYPDPGGTPSRRYWDGAAWTEHRS